MFARLRSSRSANFLVEIFMIVIGISIALWFEGLYEESQERDTEQQYLQGLADDLRTDISELDGLISDNQAHLDQLRAFIPELSALAGATPRKQADTIFAPSSYWFFEPSKVTYLSLRESGDFRLLSDPGVKESLLQLMRQYDLIDTLQGNFLQALDDGYIPLMMNKFDMIDQRISDPVLLEETLFRNFFVYAVQDTNVRVHTLKEAREAAGALLGMIESSIKE